VYLAPEHDSPTYSSSHELSIRVPRRFDVKVLSAGGDVKIREVAGRFEGNTGGGTIELHHVRGHAALNTGGGHIFVTDCTLSGQVTTGGGGVRMEGVSGG